MKLKRIKAENVYGYMNFDEKLENDVTFLIGCNGSGKTTLLNLIRALLEPSLDLLMKIDFSSVELHLDDTSKQISIKSTKDKEQNILEITIDSGSMIKDVFYLNELSALRKNERNENFEAQETVKIIKNLDCFGYISVNRDFQYKRKKYGLIPGHQDQQTKEMPEIDIAMHHVQQLIRDKNMDLSIYKSVLEEKFRNELFRTSLVFKKNDFSKALTGDYTQFSSWKQKLYEEKNQFQSFVTNFTKDELNYDNLFRELEELIDKLINLTNKPNYDKEQPSLDYYVLLFQWMVNQDNLERIDQMIGLGKTFNDKIEKSRIKFRNYVEVLNKFFCQSGKNVKIDDRGRIEVIVLSSNKKIDLMNMSSGEKHLMIIFAILIFCIKNKAIIVIDEPEISLHIGWQEIFVDCLVKANPDIQYILATHAPSIISRKERQGWCVDLTRKN